MSFLLHIFLRIYFFIYLLISNDKKSSILRPKLIASMFTPILNPNSSSSTNINPNSNPSLSQNHLELGKILRKHDPNAIRLYDVIRHVKVFLYNSNEFRWENNSYIEGNLFVYKRQQTINNQIHQSYAFAVINGEQNLIQPISSIMSHQADKLCLFYEFITNDKRQVFSLHFLNENECLRLNTFISQAIENVKQQQLRTTTNGDLQPKQTNGQATSADVYSQRTPVNVRLYRCFSYKNNVCFRFQII